MGVAGVNDCQICQRPDCMACLVVIPAYAEMACLNHWIPAFAGMTRGVVRDLPRTGVPCSVFFPSQYTLQD